MKFWSYLRKPHTLTIFAGAISSVSSPRSYVPPVTASESNASTAAAAARSRRLSGSISMCCRFLLLAAGEVGPGPVQRAFFPDVEKSGKYQNYEDRHLHEREHLQLAVNDHPRVQED